MKAQTRKQGYAHQSQMTTPALDRDFDRDQDDNDVRAMFGNLRSDLPKRGFRDLEIDPGDHPRPLDFGE